MNLLLDTNIFVPLEPAGNTDVAVNTPLALELQRLATRARCRVFLHPVIQDDLERDRDQGCQKRDDYRMRVNGDASHHMKTPANSALADQLTAIRYNYLASYRRLRRYVRDSAMRIHKAMEKWSKELVGMEYLNALRKRYEGQRRLPPQDGVKLLAGEMLEEMISATNGQPDMLYETS